MSLGRSNFNPDMKQDAPPPPALVDWHILSKATGAVPLSFVWAKPMDVILTSPPMDGGIVPLSSAPPKSMDVSLTSPFMDEGIVPGVGR
jgi:hypothetical protein